MRESLRFYDAMLRERLSGRRTAFICGPAQVGRTSACRARSTRVLDWTDIAHRLLILKGPEAVAQYLGLARSGDATVVFDNLQGHRGWKAFLRRFQLRYGPRVRVIVTLLSHAGKLPASAVLVRMNPWTVGECARTGEITAPIAMPTPISEEDWIALLEHGGFPEPFRKRDARFTQRWHARRQSDLIEQDLPRLAAVRDPSRLQLLGLLLSDRSAHPIIHSELGRRLGVAVETVARWIELLAQLQYGFCVRPWFRGVPKALRKEPRWFLRDWSAVLDPSARLRTFVACHLLKAVEGWTDLGFGRYELRYVRDKRHREVDFLVLRDGKPWCLVAVADESPRGGVAPPVLAYFQGITRARHAFYMVMGGAFSAADCFAFEGPVVVSARTLLSQLL